MNRLLCAAFLAVTLTAQSLVPIDKPPISPTTGTTYYSYSTQFPPAAPPGAIFALGFPAQSVGAQEQLSACATYQQLNYFNYSYDSGTMTWTGPLTGPLFRYF